MTDRFKIGEVEADFVYMRIVSGQGSTSIEPKVMSVLRVLVDRADEVVTRDELIDAVWGNSYGGEERLSRAISLLRKALGDVQGQHDHVETVPRKGYRLIASVVGLSDAQSTKNVAISAEEGSDSLSDSLSDKRLESAAVASDEASDTHTPLSPLSRFGYVFGFVLAGLMVFYFWQASPTSDSASDVGNSYETSAPGERENSIAVLPFADLSPTGDQQYFATGLAEEILNSLATVDGLSIAGRTSSFAYAEKPADVKTIGDALQVGYLLQGSVRKQDDRVRVSAQLVRTQDEQQIWSERFDGNVSEIFELQETVAQSIAAALAPNSLSSIPGRLARELTKDRQAYELYLQGREMSRRFGRSEKLIAIGLLEQAVERDPDFADAWAWLARSYLFIPITDPQSEQGLYIDAARDAITRALASEPELAMAHYVMALLNDYDLRFDASFDSMQRAYAAAPNQPFFAIRRGRYHIIIGQVKKGARMIEEGLRMDPTDAPGLLHLASAKIHLGEIEEGLTLMDRSESLGFFPASIIKCIYLGRMGRTAQATTCWDSLPQSVRNRYPKPLASDFYWGVMGKAFLFDDAMAREQIRPLIMKALDNTATAINPYQLAALETLREYKLFMELFVDRPFAINASHIYNLWTRSNGPSPIVQHADFPKFAERIGLVRAWEKHGLPDICLSEAKLTESVRQHICKKN